MCRAREWEGGRDDDELKIFFPIPTPPSLSSLLMGISTSCLRQCQWWVWNIFVWQRQLAIFANKCKHCYRFLNPSHSPALATHSGYALMRSNGICIETRYLTMTTRRKRQARFNGNASYSSIRKCLPQTLKFNYTENRHLPCWDPVCFDEINFAHLISSCLSLLCIHWKFVESLSGLIGVRAL